MDMHDLGLHGLIGKSGNNIKSIQYGSISISGLSATATINAVDMTKSVILHNGIKSGVYGDTNKGFVGLSLTSSTQVTAYRYADGDTPIVNFVVIEFVSVKSVQRGSISISGFSATATINAVDMTKSVILHNGIKSGAYGDTMNNLVSIELTNPTTITANRGGNGGAPVVYYTLIEFN